MTLGIIGVVSAMTIPTLIQNHQRKTYVTQLHKFYNETQQAAVRYMTDRNALNLAEAGLTNNDAAANFIRNYFKVINDCGDDSTSCFASDYRRLNGTVMEDAFSSGDNYFLLASGAAVQIGVRGNGMSVIYVDINGPKGPNVQGRDTFATVLYSNGMLDDSNPEITLNAPLSSEDREKIYEDNCSGEGGDTGYWWGCFGKILNDNWEMNY